MALTRYEDQLNEDKAQYFDKQILDEGTLLSQETQKLLAAVKSYDNQNSTSTILARQKSAADKLNETPPPRSKFTCLIDPPKEKEVDWERIEDYSVFKKYIITLLTEEFSPEKKVFLKSLRESSEDIRSLDNLKTAIKMFHQLNKTENRYNKLQQDLENDSFLKNQLKKGRLYFLSTFKKTLDKNMSEFKTKILEHKFGSATHILDQYLNKAFEKVNTERNRLKYQYPEAYKDIIRKTNTAVQNPEQPQVIQQVMSLFEDYHKKNSILFFHWRHHSKEAVRIFNELNALLVSDKTPLKKIDEATRIILREENDMADRRKLGAYIKRESSFFRRAHFAIELLDIARKQLTQAPATIKKLI